MNLFHLPGLSGLQSTTFPVCSAPCGVGKTGAVKMRGNKLPHFSSTVQVDVRELLSGQVVKNRALQGHLGGSVG